MTEVILSKGILGPTVKTSLTSFHIDWPPTMEWLENMLLVVDGGTVSDMHIKWLHTKLDEAITLSKEQND